MLTPSAWFAVPLACIAGWLLWTRLPAGPEEHDDPLETVFASLLGGVLLVGCAGVLLASVGAMSPWALTGILAAISAALWRLPRRRLPAVRPLRGEVAGFLAVTLLTAIVMAPASEDVIGGRDQGVYANIGAWVAHHGTLRVHAPALASLTEESRPLFQAGILFPGFYVGDGAQGEVFPQFLHLHPIYMAVGFWLGGLPAGLLVPPFYAVLAHLATFLFVRRLIGAGPAVVASLVLALNLAQLWVLRTTFSEGAAQFTAAATLWCLAGATMTGGLRWGVLGGLAMGAGLLVRVDAALLLVTLLPAHDVIHVMAEGPMRWWTRAFLPLTLVFAAWSIAHGIVFSPPYMRVMHQYTVPLWTASAALLIAHAGAMLFRRRARALVTWIHAHGVVWWALGAAALVALFVTGLWIRVQLEPWMYRGRRIYIEESMVRMAWYTSVTALVLACAGVVVLLREWLVRRRVEWLPFLSTFIAISLAYFWNPRVAIDHPWAMRRFVPVILPGIAVAATAALAWLWATRGRWRTPARAAAIAALAVVLVHEVRTTWPFRTFPEKRGAVEQLERLARHIPPRSLLLYTTGVEAWVATPLTYLWNLDGLPVQRRRRSDPQGIAGSPLFEAQVQRWLREGKRIFYLTEDEGHWLYLSGGLQYEPLERIRFAFRSAGQNTRQPPRTPMVQLEHFQLLRIKEAAGEARPCHGLSLDIAASVAGRTQGFHAVELAGGRPHRWTRPESRILFPTCVRPDSRRLSLRLDAACRNPGGADACRVKAEVNGVPAGVLPLSREWQALVLPIPEAAVASAAGAVDVRFSGPAYNPPPRGRHRDRRTLSFMVREVSLVERASPSAPPPAPTATAAPEG